MVRRKGIFTSSCELRILPPPSKRRWWEIFFPLRPQAELVKDLIYRDSAGERWVAPRGSVVNGLSSPRFFWRLVPPFSWRGIPGSVIHDVYCVSHDRNSKEVHAVLYDALICNGVPCSRAWGIWFVVRFFGPRFSKREAVQDDES